MLATIQRLFRILVLGTCLAAGAVSTARAEEPQLRVVVPDRPEGVIVTGCYKSVGTIYGGYRFQICLMNRGTFSIRGNGINCEGRLSWNIEGIGINIALRRTSCGNNVAWSADTLWCRPNLLAGLIGAIADPKNPQLAGLTCDYRPAAGSGQSQTQIIMRRN